MKKLLKTDLLFTAKDNQIQEGFVLIDGNKIVKVGVISELARYTDDDTEVIDLYGKVVSPGISGRELALTHHQ